MASIKTLKQPIMKSSVVHFQTRKSNQAQTILNLYSDENIRESEVKVKFIYICLKQ